MCVIELKLDIIGNISTIVSSALRSWTHQLTTDNIIILNIIPVNIELSQIRIFQAVHFCGFFRSILFSSNPGHQGTG